MSEAKRIEQLLGQVKTISKSYERLNEANGGNFNVFSVLGKEYDEVSTHSRFIAALLNPKGTHGFKDEFLKLFIDVLDIKGLEKMKTSECHVSVEAHSPITHTPKPAGGSIDILIKENHSDKHVIMIENKIHAAEQKDQLLRYHHTYPKGKLLFLTLWGDESEQESSKNIEYEAVSYEHHIIHWLEKCREVSAVNPTLRETLTQYINLIKKITNQNIYSKMNEELAQLFTDSKENYDALLTLHNLNHELYKSALETSFFPALEELQDELKSKYPDYSLHCDKNKVIEKRGPWLKPFTVESKKMKSRNIHITFEFCHEKKTQDLIGGFAHIDLEKEKASHNYYDKLMGLFEEAFKPLTIKKSGWWPCYFLYQGYNGNWQDLRLLKEVIHGNFKEDLKEKVRKLIEVFEKSLDSPDNQ